MVPERWITLSLSDTYKTHAQLSQQFLEVPDQQCFPYHRSSHTKTKHTRTQVCIQFFSLVCCTKRVSKVWQPFSGTPCVLTLILPRSRTGTVWFYTSTSNKRAARPKLYTESLTMDLKLMYSRFTLVRISINLQAPCVLYIRTSVSLLFRERFLYI